MSGCVRGCTVWRKHRTGGEEPCPVKNREDGAWLSLPADYPDRGELEHLADDALPVGISRNRWGGLEYWHPCGGCLPRQADYGLLCERCHIRLTEVFAGQALTIEDRKVWTPAEGSLAWAFDWLAADREPRQDAAGLGEVIRESKAPPAALNLAIFDLRRDICSSFGYWIGRVCGEFKLTGPKWWRHRVTESTVQGDHRWRAWLPQTSSEVVSAQRFLGAWLGRIESDETLVCEMYETALVLTKEDQQGGLMLRVASVAPWRAKPRRLGDSVPCPECNRVALVIYEGRDVVTCQKCDAEYGQKRFDLWTNVLLQERGEAS